MRNKTRNQHYEILTAKDCLKLNNSAKNVKLHLLLNMGLTTLVSTLEPDIYPNIRIYVQCIFVA